MLLHFLRWLRAHTDLEFSILLTRECRRELSRLKPSLIYANTIANGALVEELGFNGAPVLTHVHELEYWIQRLGKSNLDLVKQHTTHYVAAAEAVKENLVRTHGIPQAKISVVCSFIETNDAPRQATEAQKVRAELGVPEGAFLIGGAGVEFWRKGRDLIPHLLLALKRRAIRQEVHFVWIGPPCSASEQYGLAYDLKSAGFEAHFHSPGEVSDPLRYLDAIDAFTLLSRDDPFPLVCLEAALLSKPILCFAGAGGMPEFVDEECGFVVPYLDLETMAERICQLTAAPELRESLGRAGNERLRDRCSVEIAAPRLLRIIEATIDDAR